MHILLLLYRLYIDHNYDKRKGKPKFLNFFLYKIIEVIIVHSSKIKKCISSIGEFTVHAIGASKLEVSYLSPVDTLFPSSLESPT